MQSFKLTAASLVASMAFVCSASAAPFTLTPDSADGGIHTGSQTIDQTAGYAVRVGEYFGPSQSYVFGFQVPAIPGGEVVVTADLQVNIFEQIGALDITYNLDLYGLGTRATGGPVAGDEFEGALDLTDAVLIQDNFIVPADGTDTVNTDAAGDAALVAYLNSQFATAAVGEFIMFRLNADSAVANTNNAYNLLTSGAGLAGEKPELNFTTDVPEPGSLALLALGGLLIARRRRN